MLLALVLSQLVLQPADPRGPIVTNPATLNRFAFFEAFPASGAGTFGACSATPPTGVRGEALTFTRGSTATCTKTATGGLATTSIANGDLVVLSSNQPRVEYDSSGVLGLLVEASRTNAILRSQELDNATWTLAGIGGGTAPTVTANAATAPDGTVTADRIDFPAVGAGQTSAIYQTVGGTPYAFSFYVRGVSSGGTLDVCITGGTCPAACAYVAGSWTRCVSVLASTINPFFANYNGRGAQSVYVWGVQAESNAAYATSYIPTGAGTATRSGESAYFAASFFSTAGGASLALSSQSLATAPLFLRYNVAGNTSNRLQLDGTSLTSYNGRYNVAFVGPAPSAVGTSRAGGTLLRQAVEWNGTDTATLYAPGAAPASATLAQSSWTGGELWLSVAGGGEIDGITSRVCLDLPSRCR